MLKTALNVKSTLHYNVANPFMSNVPIKGTLANSVDLDQTPQNAASDQGHHCLHLGKELCDIMLTRLCEIYIS